MFKTHSTQFRQQHGNSSLLTMSVKVRVDEQSVPSYQIDSIIAYIVLPFTVLTPKNNRTISLFQALRRHALRHAVSTAANALWLVPSKSCALVHAAIGALVASNGYHPVSTSRPHSSLASTSAGTASWVASARGSATPERVQSSDIPSVRTAYPARRGQAAHSVGRLPPRLSGFGPEPPHEGATIARNFSETPTSG